MTVDADTFKAMFPEFCDVADSTVSIWITEGQDFLCPDAWGDCFHRAVLYFTAHNLAQAQQRAANTRSRGGKTVVSGGSGALQSASAGGLSVSYATPQFATQGNADEVDFATTPYGIKYLSLRDTCIAAGQLAGTIAKGTFDGSQH